MKWSVSRRHEWNGRDVRDATGTDLRGLATRAGSKGTGGIRDACQSGGDGRTLLLIEALTLLAR